MEFEFTHNNLLIKVRSVTDMPRDQAERIVLAEIENNEGTPGDVLYLEQHQITYSFETVEPTATDTPPAKWHRSRK